jgi:hypothetical protein
VASGQETSTPVEHPVLGPAVSIYDDRRQARASLFLYVAFFFLGILGVLLGQGDLHGGSAALGWAEIAGGAFLSLYSVRAAFIATRRLGQPIALVVGRDGFEYARGNGPVGWEEVATIGDPAAPPAKPRMLRVQLADPQNYVHRHALSPVDDILLRVHRNDLYLGNGTRMSVAAVQAMMNKRLAEFRRGGPDPVAAPASSPRTRAPRGRRPPRRR